MNHASRFPKALLLLIYCFLLLTILFSITIVSTGQTHDEWKAKFLAEIEELQKKIARKPDDAELYYELGGKYQVLTRWQEAATALERATALHPNFTQAHYELGWCYANLGKYAEAVKAHQQAVLKASSAKFKMALLKKEPTKPEAQLAVGWDYSLMKRYDEAITAYQEALRLDPKFEDALYEIGRVYLAQGKNDEVAQVAAKLSPTLRDWLLKELSLAPPPDKRPINGRDPSIQSKESDQLPKMGASLRPKVLYREKAKYTELARQNRIQGTVVLSVVFFSDGHMGWVSVVRGLPLGLTASALTAVEKIRFEPAVKDGQPVSVRGNVEFNFTLY
ncbi:MAG: TonB family protein [Acidobacteriota bacterium]